MLLIVLAMLAGAEAGTATPVQSVIKGRPSLGDYPFDAVRANKGGINSVMVSVDTEGKVIRCATTESSGSSSLDAAACRSVLHTFDFKPARNEAGEAIPGVFRTVVTWSVNGNQVKPDIDVTLSVAKMPPDYVQPARIAILFDGSGRIYDCRVTKKSGSAEADAAACAQVSRQITIPAFRSGSAEAPTAVRSVKVIFTPDASASR